LLDLMQQRALQLDRVEVFVLDEADRMLDMGFIHDIKKVVAKLPAKRQTLFFSATMPREIADLASHMLRDPVRVAVTPAATTVERITQQVVHVDRAGKPALLAEVLRQDGIERVLVFTRTKRGADKVVTGLAKAGLAAEAIHGNKSQNQRERVLAAFRAGRVRTLVATDIAARGIDVEGISHVVNYDLPNIPESYVHRIGRTARAGADGIAISFCDSEERAFLRDIEKLIRISIPATDRRSDKRAAPEPNGNGAARQPQRQRNQNRDRAHHGRGDQKPAQRSSHPSSHQQNRRADQKPARAHGASEDARKRAGNTRPEPGSSAHNPSQQHRRAEQPAHEIGAVAFMQQPRREPRRHAGAHPSRQAPR
jgi:ATP-dependent RNA helicase RhlE